MNRGYFEHLVDQIMMPSKTDYIVLLNILANKQFIWSLDIPNDENRAEDGKAIRYEYVDEVDDYMTKDDMEAPASVLEVLIALARRIDDDIGRSGENNPAPWFWMMIDNLKLTPCKDWCCNKDYVDQQIDIWLLRKFTKHGIGSPFPCPTLSHNQCQQEIWCQMNDWINANFPIF